MADGGPEPLDRARLEKLLGLLGSPHDGEALAAARKADALVRAAGLTWREVLAGPDQPPPPLTATPRHADDGFRKAPRRRQEAPAVSEPPTSTLYLSDQEVIDALLASSRVPERLKDMVRGYARRLELEGLSRDDRAHLRNLYATLRP